MSEQLEQRTTDWLDWRKKGIGASDAPIILGVSPWSTPFQLWEQKIGLVKKDGSNWATQRGNELEPRARAQFELEQMAEFPAMLCEHAKYPWARASLDGFNQEQQAALEIKCPGREDHEKARAGQVPEKYFPQLQHQLFVTGAKCVFYYSYFEVGPEQFEGVTLRVEPDLEYIKKMVAAEVAFWSCVEKKTPPPLSDRDCHNIRNAEIGVALAEYFAAKKLFDENKKIMEGARATVLAIVEQKYSHPRLNCGAFKMVKIVKAGNVDYKRVPELKGVDLSPYRKAPTTQWNFYDGTESESEEP